MHSNESSLIAISFALAAAYAITLAPIVVDAAKVIGSDDIDGYYNSTYGASISIEDTKL